MSIVFRKKPSLELQHTPFGTGVKHFLTKKIGRAENIFRPPVTSSPLPKFSSELSLRFETPAFRPNSPTPPYKTCGFGACPGRRNSDS
jgi:hypothetical protein